MGLQLLIDAQSAGDTLELPPGEFFGQVVIDRPLTVVGKGRSTWIGARSAPTIRIASSGVILKNLMVEATEAPDSVAIEAMAGTKPILEDVVVRGRVVGVLTEALKSTGPAKCLNPTKDRLLPRPPMGEDIFWGPETPSSWPASSPQPPPGPSGPGSPRSAWITGAPIVLILLVVVGFGLTTTIFRSADKCGDCQMLVDGVCRPCYEVERECVVDLCVPTDMSAERKDELRKAKQGVASSQRELGNEHFKQKQYGKAKSWLGKAAESGDTGSCFTFGAFLAGALNKDLVVVHSLQGDVPSRYVDDREAEKWLLKAANGGHDCAKNLLARLYVRMGKHSEAQYWARRCLQENHHQDSAKEALSQMGVLF